MTVLPAWFVLPLSGLMILGIAAHMVWMRQSDMPGSRRRIRMANDLLMILVVIAATYAFSVVRRSQPREWVLSWMFIVGMLGIITMLACLDILNNLRLARAERARLRHRLRGSRLESASDG
ncbi:MAG: hypothetical protein KDA28_01340 [Phycisphaerales bacterium]|nr:hypothetical protein [Phycisphaerales bacterium]